MLRTLVRTMLRTMLRTCCTPSKAPYSHPAAHPSVHPAARHAAARHTLPLATMLLGTLLLDTLLLDTLLLDTLLLDTLPLATFPLATLPLDTLPSATLPLAPCCTPRRASGPHLIHKRRLSRQSETPLKGVFNLVAPHVTLERKTFWDFYTSPPKSPSGPEAEETTQRLAPGLCRGEAGTQAESGSVVSYAQSILQTRAEAAGRTCMESTQSTLVVQSVAEHGDRALSKVRVADRVARGANLQAPILLLHTHHFCCALNAAASQTTGVGPHQHWRQRDQRMQTAAGLVGRLLSAPLAP